MLCDLSHFEDRQGQQRTDQKCGQVRIFRANTFNLGINAFQAIVSFLSHGEVRTFEAFNPLVPNRMPIAVVVVDD